MGRSCSRIKTIFPIVDEPPWSDTDDSVESMSDPEEDEDNMPDNKDSTHEGEGETEAEPDVVEADVMVVDVDRDDDGETGGEDEEEDSSDGLRAGRGLRERQKWRLVGGCGGTEDNSVGP